MTDLGFYVKQCGVAFRYFCSFYLGGNYCSVGGMEASPKQCYDRIADFMIEAFSEAGCQPA